MVNATGSNPLLPPITGLHSVVDKDNEKVMSIFGFIKNIKENEFCVDKLNLNLKVNSLNKEDTVDNIINQNLINIGVVV